MKNNYKIKCLPEYFEEILNGNKKAELRKNDRDYKVGEVYTIREWKNKRYTGREINVKITHVLKGIVLPLDWCVFSFDIVWKSKEEPCFESISVDYEAEYHRCVGTMANINNEREEAKSAILAMSSIINEQKVKIADLEKKIEDDYWGRLNNGK